MATVNFIIGDVTIEAELHDTPTAEKILAALPIEAHGSYWGDEFYFDVPVSAASEPDATDVVDPGTVAFWTAGNCLCLFWGPTPASQGSECRAASGVNIVGEVVNKDDLSKLTARTVRVM
jgi:uncharacterized protein